MNSRLPVAASLLAMIAAAAAADPVPQLAPRPAAGLEAGLVAAEPLLSSPSDIDVDARGRIWVCEVMNYRGRQETRPEGDRILVLEDTDGDGTADKRTVFHQGRDVDSALGICVIGEGPGRKVIVSCALDVFVFHDDDGDLEADRRESLFTKTGRPQHDHSVHAFVVGPDGRWYFNFGNTGGAVHDRDGNPVRDRFGNVVDDSGRPYRQGMVFRCRPDGGDFEVLGHNFRNNYEVAVDSFGGLCGGTRPATAGGSSRSASEPMRSRVSARPGCGTAGSPPGWSGSATGGSHPPAARSSGAAVPPPPWRRGSTRPWAASPAISHNFETHTALLADGRSFTGLLVSKSQAEVILRGADGIDMQFAAGAIEELVTQPVSLMPAGLASALTVQELVDVVTWLETLTPAKSPRS